MLLSELNEELTGTEVPKFTSIRERKIIEKILVIINKKEEDLQSCKDEREHFRTAFHHEITQRVFHQKQEDFYHSKLKEAYKIIDELQSEIEALKKQNK